MAKRGCASCLRAPLISGNGEHVPAEACHEALEVTLIYCALPCTFLQTISVPNQVAPASHLNPANLTGFHTSLRLYFVSESAFAHDLRCARCKLRSGHSPASLRPSLIPGKFCKG
eukprot:6457888-Amphidinium_carterae.1